MPFRKSGTSNKITAETTIPMSIDLKIKEKDFSTDGHLNFRKDVGKNSTEISELIAIKGLLSTQFSLSYDKI